MIKFVAWTSSTRHGVNTLENVGKKHQALLGPQSEKYVKSRMIEEITPLDVNEKRALKKR